MQVVWAFEYFTLVDCLLHLKTKLPKIAVENDLLYGLAQE